jgi:hypothetical protein
MDFQSVRAHKKTLQDPAGPARGYLIRAGLGSWIQNREFQEEIRYRNPIPVYRPDK